MSPKTEKLNPMKFNYQQQPNIINGGMPTFIANPYEQYVNCGNKNLSAEMIKACESFRKNNPNEYFKLSYGPSPIDERLANCEMSVEGKEITCGDDVYVLSRKVSDTSREIIKSIESNGTSKTSAPGAKIE